MTATNAMIFSLGCILYSKLSRSLYKPLFHTLYWLDGGLVCCMVRGCDNSWRMPHVENQNKKKLDRDLDYLKHRKMAKAL